MSKTPDALAELVASPQFRRSRRAAAELLGDAAGLQALLDQVDEQVFGIGRWGDTAVGVNVDIACAILEAHLEELLEAHVQGTLPTDLRRDMRCTIVIAALHYLVTEDDVIVDHPPAGRIDARLMGWATRLARAVPVA